MIITPELRSKIAYLGTDEGGAAIEALAEALWDYYSSECTKADGTELYKVQGVARFAVWLKTLPKGLRNVNNGSSI